MASKAVIDELWQKCQEMLHSAKEVWIPAFNLYKEKTMALLAESEGKDKLIIELQAQIKALREQLDAEKKNDETEDATIQESINTLTDSSGELDNVANEINSALEPPA